MVFQVRTVLHRALTPNPLNTFRMEQLHPRPPQLTPDPDLTNALRAESSGNPVQKSKAYCNSRKKTISEMECSKITYSVKDKVSTYFSAYTVYHNSYFWLMLYLHYNSRLRTTTLTGKLCQRQQQNTTNPSGTFHHGFNVLDFCHHKYSNKTNRITIFFFPKANQISKFLI